MPNPKLRAIEAHPFSAKGRDFFLLRDPLGYIEDLQIPAHWAPLLQLMDGAHSLPKIAQLSANFYAPPYTSEEIAEFVAQLDEFLLLDSPHFAQFQAEFQREFLESPVRPAAFAGKSYASEPAQLRAQLQTYFDQAQQYIPQNRPEPIRGIVVPHIDFGRGGTEEALCYTQLEKNPCDTYVVLGIAHQGVRYPFCAAAKDYQTPLGSAICDREFLSDLESQIGPRLTDEVWAHKNEHSIEFVAVFLQNSPVLRDAKIVPILCGGFWETLRAKQSPMSDSDVAQFVAALRETVKKHEKAGKKIGFIASVDGAHVGTQFGDATPLTAGRLKDSLVLWRT